MDENIKEEIRECLYDMFSSAAYLASEDDSNLRYVELNEFKAMVRKLASILGEADDTICKK